METIDPDINPKPEPFIPPEEYEYEDEEDDYPMYAGTDQTTDWSQ